MHPKLNAVYTAIALVSASLAVQAGPWLATDRGAIDAATFAVTAANNAGQLAVVANIHLGGAGWQAYTVSGSTATPLSLGGTQSSIITSINEAGLAVGWTRLAGGGSGSERAFLRSSGVTSNLGTLGGSFSAAQRINAAGQIAGVSTTASGETHAFLFANGVMTDLGHSGFHSRVTGMNAAGQVVGYSNPTSGGGVDRAFLSTGGAALVDLGTLGGAGSIAIDINAGGQVAGWADTATGRSAFVYSSGLMTDIGGLGGNYSYAQAINDAGQVAGSSKLVPGQWRAFGYSGGVMSNLGTLGGSYSTSNDINAAGQILGSSTITGDLEEDYFLYDAGSMLNLDDLVAGLGIVDVNSAVLGDGWIAGSGIMANGTYRLFRLEQAPAPENNGVPEPGSLALVALALFGAVGASRRR